LGRSHSNSHLRKLNRSILVVAARDGSTLRQVEDASAKVSETLGLYPKISKLEYASLEVELSPICFRVAATKLLRSRKWPNL
jgi:hypothetical protein